MCSDLSGLEQGSVAGSFKRYFKIWVTVPTEDVLTSVGRQKTLQFYQLYEIKIYKFPVSSDGTNLTA